MNEESKNGEGNAERAVLTARELERFVARIDYRPGRDECWAWLGKLNGDGRGRFTARGEMDYAYRWVVRMQRGGLPAGAVVRHLCGNPSCCRPTHLAVGDQRENNLDTVEQGRHRSAKLDAQKARRVRERSASPDRPSGQELGREYGVSPSAISAVVTGRTWPRAGGPVQGRRGEDS